MDSSTVRPTVIVSGRVRIRVRVRVRVRGRVRGRVRVTPSRPEVSSTVCVESINNPPYLCI
jgi:hypothetical protein